MTFETPDLDHPVDMLRAVTMAFMVLLSRQENMSFEITLKEMQTFPYDCFRLAATGDPETKTQTFMLVSENGKVC